MQLYAAQSLVPGSSTPPNPLLEGILNNQIAEQTSGQGNHPIITVTDTAQDIFSVPQQGTSSNEIKVTNLTHETSATTGEISNKELQPENQNTTNAVDQNAFAPSQPVERDQVKKTRKLLEEKLTEIALLKEQIAILKDLEKQVEQAVLPSVKKKLDECQKKSEKLIEWKTKFQETFKLLSTVKEKLEKATLPQMPKGYLEHSNRLGVDIVQAITNRIKSLNDKEASLDKKYALLQELWEAVQFRSSEVAKEFQNSSYLPTLSLYLPAQGSVIPEQGLVTPLPELQSVETLSSLLKKVVDLREKVRHYEFAIKGLAGGNPSEIFKDDFAQMQQTFVSLSTEIINCDRTMKQKLTALEASYAEYNYMPPDTDDQAQYNKTRTLSKIEEQMIKTYLVHLKDRVKKTVDNINSFGNAIAPTSNSRLTWSAPKVFVQNPFRT